ncbi:MAG TPA: ATP phosphoribosyltransferase regulatory subunit, partial [Alphaproteobacteria bacterium]|nr:ATP phosphoribosyltransferase regulatory subunit [Alphaproteobacteria bacterium]
PCQFLQAGVECLGIDDKEAADAEVLAVTLAAVQATGLSEYAIEIGDVGLFFGLIDQLQLPERWRLRLKHQFWRPGQLQDLINRLSGAPELRSEEHTSELQSRASSGAPL